ncbi:hypothetical protein D0856_02870 [Vibrio owensii]|uniref:hypothetical protein n=1 Tax=Vibrio owensii TaxID=696485 RepID=UPI000EFB878B|nr:hypothetical protein [Vibrio owensii]AYO19178.1 hypothetical protein D0856_02870 [Vibrio owensii]
MNRLLQQQLAKVVMTTGNDQSRVTAIKELDKLGDELDVTIFDEWTGGQTGVSVEVSTASSAVEYSPEQMKLLMKLAGGTDD